MDETDQNRLTEGSVPRKMLAFALPIFLSNLFQQLYNAVDSLIVGNFIGSTALAAVGSTSSLINLLINVFVGLSVGVNVLVARYYGAQNDRDVSETVHTAVTTSIVSGFILVVLGILLANPLLRLMGTPEDVLGQSVLYMRIYFLGMPVLMVYNFGAAILRAIGDTRRPLYFLFASGVVNVCLNLFFVVVLGMGVDGVAWATVISEHISAFLVLKSLMGAPGALKLDLKQLRIHTRKLKRIVKIGLPAGMQGAIFSISNVLIQSSVNSFGSIAMAGNTASSNIEGFVYTAMNAVYQTNLSFTSQNLGGRKYSRINKIMYICLGVVTAVGVILGFTAAGDGLLHIYSSDPEVLHYGMLRLEIICGTYFLCGIMDCMVGSLRGLGYSIIPMFVSLTGACGFRVLWVFTVFAAYRSLDVLYLSYPVSWAITAIAHMVTFHKIRRKIPRQDAVSM